MPHVVIHTDLLLVLVILDTQGMESRALVVFYSILSYWLNSFDMYKLFEDICNIGVYRMVKSASYKKLSTHCEEEDNSESPDRSSSL